MTVEPTHNIHTVGSTKISKRLGGRKSTSTLPTAQTRGNGTRWWRYQSHSPNEVGFFITQYSFSLIRFLITVWKNLLPKIAPLLDDNRIRVDENERQLRKDARCEKICELMDQLNEDTYPYHAITQALNIEPPGNIIEYLDGARDLVHPFPSFPAISECNAISCIYNEEHSLETVEEMFNLNREEIGKEVVKWREEVEDKLVGQYVLDCDDVIQVDTTLTVGRNSIVPLDNIVMTDFTLD